MPPGLVVPISSEVEGGTITDNMANMTESFQPVPNYKTPGNQINLI